MIDGVGQKGPFQFSMPDLSNLAMAFDFGALLAEADRSREMPQLSQRDFDERDDGLGFHDGSGASDLRSNVGRDAHGEPWNLAIQPVHGRAGRQAGTLRWLHPHRCRVRMLPIPLSIVHCPLRWVRGGNGKW